MRHRDERRFVLIPLLLWLGITSFARADDVTIVMTVTNDRPLTAYYLRLTVSPLAEPLHDIVALELPPLCPAPQISPRFFDGGPQLLDVSWPCECVQPGQSFKFSVQAPAGTVLSDPVWSGGTSALYECDGVVADRPRLADLNGDLDGYPDTNETVDFDVSLKNRWPANLTNAVAHLSTSDPKVDCIPISSVSLGNFPAGASIALPAPFRLHVSSAADRAGAVPPVACTGGLCSNGAGPCATAVNCQKTVNDDYAVAFTVTVTADQLPAGEALPAFTYDFDLDSATPVASTSTWVEGFESGFGKFTSMNLDTNRASNALSDGFRCQYNDPDFPNSNSYGETECYLGFAAGQSLFNDWHVHTTTAPDGGHAYLGARSLHYGKHTSGNPGLDTYGLSQMDAMRTNGNINLAARVCRDDPAPDKRACASAADCVTAGGGPCVAAAPELTFKHQVATPSDCYMHELQKSVDRAIVAARISTAATWRKIYPHVNVYDYFGDDEISNCSFDPIDDGNDEDDYFDPADPLRYYGPSSTCFPEKAFSVIGNTDQPFNPANVGHASDGPGLAGSLGTGTWIESKYDLSRFRGRSIQLRWLFTTLKVGDQETWAAVVNFNPIGCDDGWYVDDVRVSETLGTAVPTVTADAKNNALLPGNADCDAAMDDVDCAPSDPTAFALPEVAELRFAADKVTLNWISAIPAAGSGTLHDVVRGASETCLISGTAGATANDATLPATGAGFWYLVRARNACGAGTYGSTSDGTPRTSSACP